MNDKVLVSQRAVLQRINRKLKPEDRKLKTSRSARAEQDLGRYYMIDFNRNWVVATDVNLDDLARELKVLGEWRRYRRNNWFKHRHDSNLPAPL
jgi:hypothetical protein